MTNKSNLNKNSFLSIAFQLFTTGFRSIYLLVSFKNLSILNLRQYAFLLKDKKYLNKISKKYSLNPDALNILCILLRFRIIYIIFDFIFSIMKFILKILYLDHATKIFIKKNEVRKLNILLSNENKNYSHQENEIMSHIEDMTRKIHFCLLLDIHKINRYEINKTLISISDQIYKNFCIALRDNISIEEEKYLRNFFGDRHVIMKKREIISEPNTFLVFISGGNIIHSHLLYEYASILNIDDSLDLVYADEMSFYGKSIRGPNYDDIKFHSPFSKPDWSPDYLETFNYIGYGACFRTTKGNIAHFLNYYDFVLKYTEAEIQIKHIRKLLVAKDDTFSEEDSKDIQALSERLKRTNRNGSVQKIKTDNRLIINNINIELPKMSVVIPTAGNTYKGKKGIARDLIVELVKDLRKLDKNNNIEIVVVHNDNLTDHQLSFITKNNCILVNYGKKIFNISKKLNLGVKSCSHEILLLMNDDIEFLDDCWIEELYIHLTKPHVGVVGSKLLYPNMSIQHAGVVFNYGNPDHVARYSDRNNCGYFNSISSTHNYSAVTGAIMMTRKSIYNEVGGYDEELAVSFNDIDYCLKIREKGYHVVYEPKSELIHLESVSRKPNINIDELDYFYRKWPNVSNDPFYNQKMLTVCPPTFEERIHNYD